MYWFTSEVAIKERGIFINGFPFFFYEHTKVEFFFFFLLQEYSSNNLWNVLYLKNDLPWCFEFLIKGACGVIHLITLGIKDCRCYKLGCSLLIDARAVQASWLKRGWNGFRPVNTAWHFYEFHLMESFKISLICSDVRANNLNFKPKRKWQEPGLIYTRFYVHWRLIILWYF